MFTSPQSGGGKTRLISVDRARHGTELRRQLALVEAGLASRRGRAVPAGVEAPSGFYLEFESPAGFELKLESLESLNAGIELVAARLVDGKTFATVFVPQGELSYFVKKVEDYLHEDTRHGKPKNKPLVESIEALRLAIVESFWTDELASLPASNERVWWEVWLRGEKPEVLARFREQAEQLKVEVGQRSLTFPERTVVLAQGS